MNIISNQIQNPQIKNVLNALHQDAKYDSVRMMKAAGKLLFGKLEPKDVKAAYLPISEKQGKFIFDLIVKNELKNVVEFGTSFGVSTLYLAAAVQQTGGKVVTTEIIPEKCEQASKNFAKAGMESFIELREGDAMKTLSDWNEPIDFLLLDGWKDLYAPLFNMLEKHFHENTIVYVDNADFGEAQSFLSHVQRSGRYSILPVQGEGGKAVLVSKI